MEEAFAAEVNATTPEEIEAAQAAQAEIEARSELLRNAPPAAGSPYRVTTPRSVATKRRVPWVSTIILLAFGSWAANEAYLRNGHDLLLSFGIGVLAAFALWIPARVYAAERRAKADLYAAPGHLQTSPAETAARNGLGPAIHGPAQVVDDTMPCPRCAETIKRAAKMCRFCLLEMSD
jgi:hypothetical protein